MCLAFSAGVPIKAGNCPVFYINITFSAFSWGGGVNKHPSPHVHRQTRSQMNDRGVIPAPRSPRGGGREIAVDRVGQLKAASGSDTPLITIISSRLTTLCQNVPLLMHPITWAGCKWSRDAVWLHGPGGTPSIWGCREASRKRGAWLTRSPPLHHLLLFIPRCAKRTDGEHRPS